MFRGGTMSIMKTLGLITPSRLTTAAAASSRLGIHDPWAMLRNAVPKRMERNDERIARA